MAEQSVTLTHGEEGPRRPGATACEPHLVLAFEADRPLAPPARFALGRLDVVALGRGPARAWGRAAPEGARTLTVHLADRWMSGTHARLARVLGRWVLEDQGSRNGTFVNGERLERAVLADGDRIELGHTFFLYRAALPRLPHEPEDLDGAALADAPAGLATLAPALGRELELLGRVAPTRVAVFIAGETGTGKELVARAVHALSGRSGAFVAVNCGALPASLLETELFGHRKGAFSGADEDRPGLIRAADHGTLFLDEIGDLPPASQAAFLRVLQEQEVVPVGATRPVKVDLRLVSATHRELDDLVARGTLRPDLAARLAGFSLSLPPLRARSEDLGLIIGHLVRRLAPERAPRLAFAVDATRALLAHDWPRNVRELEKALGAALALAAEGPVALWHLPEAVRAAPARAAAPAAAPPLAPEDAALRAELEALLRTHGGNLSAVARALGKARMQVQRWVKRFGLDPAAYR